MGAVFDCAVVPEFQRTPERVEALRQLLAGLSDSDLKPWLHYYLDNGDETDFATVRIEILWAVHETQDASREIGSLYLNGMDWRGRITGGMSWGDPATDAQMAFDIVTSCDPVYQAMLAMAREDFKAEQTKTVKD